MSGAPPPGHHIAAAIAVHPRLASCAGDMERGVALLEAAVRNGRKVLLCGNGGSAADCDHWSAELLKGFGSRRPLSAAQRAGIDPALADRLQGGIRAIPLPALTAFNTAWANDCAAEDAFAQLVQVLGLPGDVLVGLSTSGNARNVVTAFEVARARGLHTLALTGRGGGKLAPLAEVAIRVPEDATPLVQELHLPVYHALSLELEARLF
jgi:D-sedoheptulose 7-phosphate isomerase